MLEPDLLITVPVCILLILSIVTNGIEHGHIYTRENDKSDDHPIFSTLRIHVVDVVQEWSYYGLAILTGANPIALLGASMLARPAFQGFINLGVGKPFVWEEEPDTFEVWIGGWNVYERPKFIRGKGRLVKASLGALVLLLYVPISRGVLYLLSLI